MQSESAAAQDNGDIRFAIKTTDSGEKYVRADRQVIFGNNPRSWGEQVENYINRAFFQDSDGAYYSLDISVAQNDTGNIVYNIGNVKRRNFPTARNASNGSSANSGAQGGETSSSNNIPQTVAESKGNFSLKGTENADEIAALRRENKFLTERTEELQRQRDYWRKQTLRSNPPIDDFILLLCVS